MPSPLRPSPAVAPRARRLACPSPRSRDRASWRWSSSGLAASRMVVSTASSQRITSPVLPAASVRR